MDDKNIVKIAREDDCSKIVNFLNLKTEIYIRNFNLNTEYLSLENLRSRIYYFDEAFFLGIDNKTKEIVALESFVLPDNFYGHTINLNIIKALKTSMLEHIHQQIYLDLEARGFKKLRFDVVNAFDTERILQKIGMNCEVVLKKEIDGIHNVYCYSQFFNRKEA